MSGQMENFPQFFFVFQFWCLPYLEIVTWTVNLLMIFVCFNYYQLSTIKQTITTIVALYHYLLLNFGVAWNLLTMQSYKHIKCGFDLTFPLPLPACLLSCNKVNQKSAYTELRMKVCVWDFSCIVIIALVLNFWTGVE